MLGAEKDAVLFQKAGLFRNIIRQIIDQKRNNQHGLKADEIKRPGAEIVDNGRLRGAVAQIKIVCACQPIDGGNKKSVEICRQPNPLDRAERNRAPKAGGKINHAYQNAAMR